MRAVKFDKELTLDYNCKRPEIKEGEVLIKISLAGVCNTDIEITQGYMGFSGIIGHEFVGIVEKTSPENSQLLGKRVVGEINCACNTCEYCFKGLKTHCPNRTVIGIYGKDGCFADYITLPVENITEVPDIISDEEAVFVEPLAAAIQILEQVHIKSSDKVAVLGDGKLGLLTALALNSAQANILLVGKYESKLKIASEQGIKTMLSDNLETKKQFDVVIEATGSINGFEKALSILKPRGTLILKSTVASGKEFNLAPVVIDEINVVGSRCGAFKPAVRLLEKKQLNLQPMITRVFDFDNAIEAIELSRKKGILKVFIRFN